MIVPENTNGFASSIQVFGSTGEALVTGAGVSGTGASVSYYLYTIDEHGDQIPVETLSDKLAAIREKSHSKLGEAWSRLAQM